MRQHPKDSAWLINQQSSIKRSLRNADQRRNEYNFNEIKGTVKAVTILDKRLTE